MHKNAARQKRKNYLNSRSPLSLINSIEKIKIIFLLNLKNVRQI